MARVEMYSDSTLKTIKERWTKSEFNWAVKERQKLVDAGDNAPAAIKKQQEKESISNAGDIMYAGLKDNVGAIAGGTAAGAAVGVGIGMTTDKSGDTLGWGAGMAVAGALGTGIYSSRKLIADAIPDSVKKQGGKIKDAVMPTSAKEKAWQEEFMGASSAKSRRPRIQKRWDTRKANREAAGAGSLTDFINESSSAGAGGGGGLMNPPGAAAPNFNDLSPEVRSAAFDSVPLMGGGSPGGGTTAARGRSPINRGSRSGAQNLSDPIQNYENISMSGGAGLPTYPVKQVEEISMSGGVIGVNDSPVDHITMSGGVEGFFNTGSAKNVKWK